MNHKHKKEYEVIALMIKLYCNGNHSVNNGLCEQCKELKDYATERIDKCPCVESKTFCSSCTVHCYREDMRNKVKQVMRYSGPRMIVHNPLMAINHVMCTIKFKRIASLKKKK